MTPPSISYKNYWIVWSVLLILTLAMVLTAEAGVSRTLLAAVLIGAMLIKASLIGGYFMHLRFEKPVLVLIIAVGIFFIAGTLFSLIAPDGLRILRSSSVASPADSEHP